jgi:hypothetical protein
MKTLTWTAIWCVVWAGVLLLAVDGIEYEITGRCDRCLVLDKLRPGLFEE